MNSMVVSKPTSSNFRLHPFWIILIIGRIIVVVSSIDITLIIIFEIRLAMFIHGHRV